MSRGSYRRLAGHLHIAGRTPILETRDNELVPLVTDEDLSSFEDELVVVEGHLGKSGRLSVNWIGRVSNDPD